MISKSLLPLSLLLVAGSVSAQTGAALTAEDTLGVYANSQQSTVRAGTAAPIRISVNDQRQAYADSSATLIDRGATGANFAWNGTAMLGNAAGTLGGQLTPAAQKYRLDLSATTSVTGSLVLSFSGQALEATAGATILVGREVRRFDAAGGAGRASIDNLTIDPRNGLTATIEIVALASPVRVDADYGCTLNAVFVPNGGGGGGCTVSPGTSSCPTGGVLSGRATSSGRGFDLQLSLNGALPNAVGVAIASGRPDTFTIGQTGCIFFNDPIVVGAFQTDARGSATTMFTIPGGMQATMYIHEGTFVVSPRGVQLGTSNTLQVTCR